MDNSPGIIVEGLDVIAVIKLIGRKNRRFIAMSLKRLEEIIPKDSQEYVQIRKLILDLMNNYTRAALKIIFGDIEHIINNVKS